MEIASLNTSQLGHEDDFEELRQRGFGERLVWLGMEVGGVGFSVDLRVYGLECVIGEVEFFFKEMVFLFGGSLLSTLLFLREREEIAFIITFGGDSFDLQHCSYPPFGSVLHLKLQLGW